MKKHLLSTRSFRRPRALNTTATRMSYSTAATRQPRTLAQCSRLAISSIADDADIRAKYRPFLLNPDVEATDWISELELETAIAMAEENLSRTNTRLKVLVLYGSLRQRYESEPKKRG